MQRELFAAAPLTAVSDSDSRQKTSFGDRPRFTLRFDQALILMIGLLIIYVLVFSFGVETGKRYSMAELRAERAKRERVTEVLGRKIFELQQIIANRPMAVPAAEKSQSVPIGQEITQPVSKVPSPGNSSAAEIPSKPAGRYTIQAITVAAQTTAAREIKKLTDQGHQAFIIPGGKKLQICVDGFESRDEASRRMRELKSQRLIPADAYVRTIA